MRVGELFRGIGRLCGDLSVPFSGVSIDSRGDCRGKVFFALRGKRFDGHLFVEEAFRKGAVAAVVERESGDYPLVVVEDTLDALSHAARRWRDAVSPFVFGITGSAGKTTTKEMLHFILGRGARAEKTYANENNLIGLPLHLLNMPPDTEVFVAELGTNSFGEIERLAWVCAPDIAVITSVGEAHLEGLGNVEGVFREKVSILKHTKRALVFSLTSPFAERARALCEEMGLSFVGVGGEDAWFEEVEPGVYRFHLFGKEALLTAAFCGRHMGEDALLALAAAHIYGVPLEEAVAALGDFEPVAGRFSLKRLNGVLLIDDTYNANPISTRAALDYLGGISGRKLFVFGDMLELGPESHRLHREIGEYALGRVDFMLTLGEYAASALDAFRRGGGRGVHCGGHQEALEVLSSVLGDFDVVLVKGSRGMKMERIVEGIEGCSGSFCSS